MLARKAIVITMYIVAAAVPIFFYQNCGFQAKDESDNQGSSSSPVQATWTSLNEKVFQPKCFPCHYQGSGRAAVYSTYQSTIQSGLQNTLNRILDGSMPPSNAQPPIPPITDDELAALQEWQQQGAPEN